MTVIITGDYNQTKAAYLANRRTSRTCLPKVWDGQKLGQIPRLTKNLKNWKSIMAYRRGTDVYHCRQTGHLVWEALIAAEKFRKPSVYLLK